MDFTSVELCAGAGGQALGLEQAGFEHVALVEYDAWASSTLRLNRPQWNVVEDDLNEWDGARYKGVDLVAGGVPCPPFSVAGKQLGASDERDLFPAALRLVEQIQPKAVMFENVRGLMTPKFDDYRQRINDRLSSLGYTPRWRLLNACHYGVSQLRPRAVMVALDSEFATNFEWPEPHQSPPRHVGDLLVDLMSSNGWEHADQWAKRANRIAPTLVGGSKKHGGPDLGPSRARKAWAELGVDGRLIGNNPPHPGFQGMPHLTTRMAARIQGFPDDWEFAGAKTNAYRQIGNAFPPPVARAVGRQIARALSRSSVDV
ncbi:MULTISPECIES: DNA cytosine methyltransferase [unclassified Actinobaculum]|uniref:DNA cytosine methyltransferase n=1 Tax=unclassified Actinobaculum TaxID=2609299 RepID=UPI000D5277F1|nr:MULTISPECIES: DNA cytosine methyltransferase [unclassified Actinobaculum]AWE41734.1 DNA (cytosine-5-)-methyltransferase [Actinobaculum sp. 313]RTE50353.1 DNA cytosine methyltransferase [Actinobaculum sp. 352]